MPCDRKHAVGQIQRLAGLPNWANLERQAKTELADTLAASTVSDYHATQTISDFLLTAQWLTAPAEIRTAAANARTTPAPVGSGGCEHCGYSGRVSEWYLWTVERHPSGDVKRRTRELIPTTGNFRLMYAPDIPTGKDQQVAPCNDFCTCDLGQRMRAGYLRYRSDHA